MNVFRRWSHLSVGMEHGACSIVGACSHPSIVYPKSFHLLDLLVFVYDYVEKLSYLLACFRHCYRFPLLWVLIYQSELQNNHFQNIELIWMFASPSRCCVSQRSSGSLVVYLTDGGPWEVGGVGTLPRSAHI